MAEAVLHPDSHSFPPGTAVQVYALPTNGIPLSGKPSGAMLEEPTVASNGSLTVKGLTEGVRYVGWHASGGTDYYLRFLIPLAPESEGGAVASVNGKVGAVVLSAADVEAVGTASPTFTGTPKAPTAAPGTNSTQLATTAYADAIAALGLLKASNLSDLPNAGTARTNLGLGTAATQASGAFDAAGVAATAQTAAEAAASPRLTVHAVITESGTTATAQQLTPVNAEGGAKTIKLPEPTAAGQRIAVEKKDGTQNEVTVEGSIRGEASTTPLGVKGEVVEYVSDGAKSWWPIARSPKPVWTSVEGINGNAAAAGAPYSEAVQAALLADGTVRVSGELKINVEIVANSTLFTLPAACRPEKQRGGIIGGLGGTASINVIIKTTGVVENVSAIKTTIGVVQLDSIAFRLKG